MNILEIYISLIDTVIPNSPDVEKYVNNVLDYVKNDKDMNYLKKQINNREDNREDIIRELNKQYNKRLRL